MFILIITFGVLVLLAGISIIINPKNIFGLLKRNITKLELHLLAVVVRLLSGTLLIYQSGISKFPLAIKIIGWISIFAAVIFTVIGRTNFIRIMSRLLSLVKPLVCQIKLTNLFLSIKVDKCHIQNRCLNQINRKMLLLQCRPCAWLQIN